MIKSGKYFVQVNTDDKVLFDTLQEANISYMQAVNNSTPNDYITIGETDGNRIIQYDSSRGMLKNSRQIKSAKYIVVELEKDADQFNSTKEYYDSNAKKVSKPKGNVEYKYVNACDGGWMFGTAFYQKKEDAIDAAIHSSKQIDSSSRSIKKPIRDWIESEMTDEIKEDVYDFFRTSTRHYLSDIVTLRQFENIMFKNGFDDQAYMWKEPVGSSRQIKSAADVKRTLTGFMKSDFCDLDKSETEEFKQFLADEKGVYEEDYSKLRPLSEWLEFLSDFEELKEVTSSEDIQSAKVVRRNSMIKSAYTREDYDRFDENGEFIPYKPTEEELAKKDEIKKVLEQELLDAYEPDPMDDYAGYDTTDARVDMACEQVAKQFNVDTDFVEEIAGEIEYDLWVDGNKEWEWVNTPGNLTSEQYDQYMNGELDVRPLMLKSSRQIKSEYSKYAMSYDGKDGIRIVDRFTGKTFDTFHLDAEDYEKDRLLSWLLYQFNHRVNKNEVDKNTRDILTKYGINIDNLALVWDGPESFHINCSKQIKSSPNFKKFTADEIFDSFQMEELIHTVFMDREECKNAKCGMNEFSDLMYDVLPGYLGVYTADDVREVCRRAKNPKAKAFLEAFETALENAKFVDKFYSSIKVHKKAVSSRKPVKSDAASEQKLKEDLIRQGYTEDEATQIVEQRKPENVESSKMFTKDNNWKYNTAVLPTSKSMLKSFFRNGSWSWDTTIALVGTIDGGRPYIIFGAKGSYPELEKRRGLFHDQTLNDIGWFTFDRYCNDDSVFDIPEAKYAVLK